MKKITMKTEYINRGQSLVELALIMPILLLLILGIIEFGRIFDTYIILTNAARDASRLSSLGQSDIEIMDALKESTPTLIQSNLIVKISPEEDLRTRGVMTSADLTYKMPIISPIINTILPNPFIINTYTVMRVE